MFPLTPYLKDKILLLVFVINMMNVKLLKLFIMNLFFNDSLSIFCRMHMNINSICARGYPHLARYYHRVNLGKMYDTISKFSTEYGYHRPNIRD